MDIKHKVTGEVLFSCDKKTIKECVIEAVKKGAYLRGAYLQGADLEEADLWGAYLREAYLRGADLWGANLYGIKISTKERDVIVKTLQWEITEVKEVGE